MTLPLTTTKTSQLRHLSRRVRLIKGEKPAQFSTALLLVLFKLGKLYESPRVLQNVPAEVPQNYRYLLAYAGALGGDAYAFLAILSGYSSPLELDADPRHLLAEVLIALDGLAETLGVDLEDALSQESYP